MEALTVSDVSKAYKRYPSKWARLQEWLTGRPCHEKTWVLQEISLGIPSGRSLAIVGANGAGKSTLLKIITGTTQATTGSVSVRGRLAALLELGMGFHPDFTGRQNAFVAGQLLGYRVDEIGSVMPEIESFADIGEYLDRPVRIYSSGMQVRLAFSVATAIRPDVLIVDEALSVGDVFFQQKCFDRIRRFREQGTTLLFVSHAMGTVYSLCDEAILIEKGRIALRGSPRDVIDLYNAKVAISASSNTETVRIHGGMPAASATGGTRRQSAAPAKSDAGPAGNGAATVGSYSSDGVDIESVILLADGVPATAVVGDGKLAVRIQVLFRKPFADPHVGFQLRNGRGEAVFMTTSAGTGRRLGSVDADSRVEVEFSFLASVAEGEYTIAVGVANGAIPEGGFEEALARIQDAASVVVMRNVAGIRWSGLVNLSPVCDVRRLPALEPPSG